MSAWYATLLRFLDTRLDALLRTPALWGSSESVELEFLQLMEVRTVLVRPSLAEKALRCLQLAYEAFVQQYLPGAAPETLASLLAAGHQDERLVELLGEFRREFLGETILIADRPDPGDWEALMRLLRAAWPQAVLHDVSGGTMAPVTTSALLAERPADELFIYADRDSSLRRKSGDAVVQSPVVAADALFLHFAEEAVLCSVHVRDEAARQLAGELRDGIQRRRVRGTGTLGISSQNTEHPAK
jgi:hypothetical protein